jgi:MFS family permease
LRGLLFYGIFAPMANSADSAIPRDRTRLMVAIFFFVSGFGFSTWASRIPTIQQRMHLNEAELGGVLFALPVGLLATLPVTGALLSRFDSRRIMMIGAVFFNVMLMVIGFATQPWQLIVALVCFGSSRNLLNISANAQSIGVQALYDKSIIARFHGIWSLALLAGAALGAVMVSFSVPSYWHFSVVGVLLTVLCIYAYPGSLRQQPAPQEKRPLFALPSRTMVKYGLIAFASMACEGTMIDWSGIYYRKAVHTNQSVATLGYVVYTVAMTMGRLTGDRVASRYGIRKMLTYSGLLIGGGLLIAVLLPYPLTAGLGFVLTGFGVSCVIPMVFSMAGRSEGMSSGSAIASVSTVSYLGFLIVPPLVGSVAQAAGLRGAFGMMIGFGLLITILVRLTLTDERPLGAADQEAEEQGREADRFSL